MIELKGQTLKVSSEQSPLPSGLYKNQQSYPLFRIGSKRSVQVRENTLRDFPGTFAETRTHRDFVPVNSDRFLKRGMNSFLLARAVNSLMLVIPKSWLKRSL